MTESGTTNGEIWERQPGETSIWYNRFFAYYLLVPIGRSVRGAWVLATIEKRPDWRPAPGQNHPHHWRLAAIKYKWVERAAAYDKYQQRAALETIASVRLQLQQAAPQALQALLEALTSPRTRVPAATAIFDRAGIPATTKSEIVAKVAGVSADELAQAAKEAEEWERAQKGDAE